MVNIKTFITQSVPNTTVSSITVIKTLGIGMGIIYFLFIFLEPFNFSVSEEYNKYLVFFAFILVYFLTLFIAIKWILPSINKLFKVKRFYLYHFILGYLFLIILVAFAHTVFQNYLNDLQLFSLSEFKAIIPNAIFIGLIPTLIVSLLSYTQSLKKQVNQNVKDLSSSLKPIEQDGHIMIMSDNAKNQFRFEATTIIYIKSEDNYIKVFYKDETSDLVKHELIRTLLKNITPKLEIPFLRVHRSYLVNTNYVHKISGNAQGMKLTLKYIEEIIPVSRGYVSQFKDTLNAL